MCNVKRSTRVPHTTQMRFLLNFLSIYSSLMTVASSTLTEANLQQGIHVFIVECHVTTHTQKCN